MTTFVIRGADMRRCGCQGACTTDAIQLELNNSMNHAQRRRYIGSRFDGGPLDEYRNELAKTEYPRRFACTEYRGDLPERCQKAGIKGHSGYFGCMVCMAKSSDKHARYGECSLHSIPWPVRTQDTFLAEVASQLVRVDFSTLAQKHDLLDLLERAPKYPWGRTVTKACSQFGLMNKDRLVFGGDIRRDMYDLETLELPATVYFFRPAKHSGLSGLTIMCHIPGVPIATGNNCAVFFNIADVFLFSECFPLCCSPPKQMHPVYCL